MTEPSDEDLARLRAAALEAALDGDAKTSREITAVANMVAKDKKKNPRDT